MAPIVHTNRGYVSGFTKLRRAAIHGLGRVRLVEHPGAVVLRSDLLGGLAIAAFVFGVGWICVRTRCPLWLARTFLIIVPVIVGYVAADATVPEYNRPWGVWAITLGLPIGPVLVGWPLLDENYKNYQRSRSAMQQQRERRGDSQ